MQGSRQLPKRNKVTAVACQPCQTRKSKCDGGRPVCSACVSKGRTDCVYDTASDQRRTVALKQRIEELTTILESVLTQPTAEAVWRVMLEEFRTEGLKDTSTMAQKCRQMTQMTQMPQLGTDIYGMAESPDVYTRTTLGEQPPGWTDISESSGRDWSTMSDAFPADPWYQTAPQPPL
ncbi:hypothetical protein EJ06DRAFT_394998 [Trichodelitschia bisporula]|uniref:Zn(2)-C6 fungal-type domain-containing protein n=1 Tax=Trichodelitschia bisporula TaxID=703511 RepID=A0A6G1I0C4_9PEZI|nr:hypothetical protein EJ06DRAFT_394998 [Trichodelitschia bisporula]